MRIPAARMLGPLLALVGSTAPIIPLQPEEALFETQVGECPDQLFEGELVFDLTFQPLYFPCMSYDVAVGNPVVAIYDTDQSVLIDAQVVDFTREGDQIVVPKLSAQATLEGQLNPNHFGVVNRTDPNDPLHNATARAATRFTFVVVQTRSSPFPVRSVPARFTFKGQGFVDGSRNGAGALQLRVGLTLVAPPSGLSNEELESFLEEFGGALFAEDFEARTDAYTDEGTDSFPDNPDSFLGEAATELLIGARYEVGKEVRAVAKAFINNDSQTGLPVDRNPRGHASGFIDPVFRFDQAAFDARHEQSFRLDRFFEVRLSPGLVVSERVPEPRTPFLCACAALGWTAWRRRRRA
ncbi:MAG: hypothetical protein QNK03_08565 [Myxococcota bacterium]|nr:hypothetical protein [Myxococcota bacterium]